MLRSVFNCVSGFFTYFYYYVAQYMYAMSKRNRKRVFGRRFADTARNIRSER